MAVLSLPAIGTQREITMARFFEALKAGARAFKEGTEPWFAHAPDETAGQGPA